MLRTTLAIGLGVAALAAVACYRAEAVTEPVDVPGPVELATFAGGCFWCMEPPFEGQPGVRSVISGYTGGAEVDPTYEQVARGQTGHTESVQIDFNPEIISYDDLLDIYWRSCDPTDPSGQFADRGTQYRPGIFFHSDEQRAAAERSRVALGSSGRFDKPIVVEVTEFRTFYPAEDYHQDYYKKNPVHYNAYAIGSGRKGFLKRVWGGEAHPKKGVTEFRRPDDGEIRKRLTSLQYQVTQNEGTESPFANEYWDNKEEGIYVDIVSGEPLFSSQHKYRSGTGWPSFDRPLVANNVTTHTDRRLFLARTEVRSKHADSHLGHLFTDGPRETTGLRYCLNSAALRFVPLEELDDQGYGEFRQAFVESGNNDT